MDKDLEFLRYCDNDDLVILTDYISKDKKGKNRLTERLTSTNEYKAYYPNNLKNLVDKIEKEFRLFGENTLVNLVRGNGPSYREILTDVAKRTKTKFDKHSTVKDIEANLIENILEKELESMSEEELTKMREELGEKSATKGTTKHALIYSTLSLMKEGGFATYKNTFTLANRVSKMVLGRGLTVVGGSILSRGLRFLTSPIGWSIVDTWTVLYLSKPAYRVTVPCVIHIAYMRAKQEYLSAQNSV